MPRDQQLSERMSDMAWSIKAVLLDSERMCAGVPPPFSLRKLPASSSDPSVMVSILGRKVNLDRNSPLSKDDRQCGMLR